MGIFTLHQDQRFESWRGMQLEGKFSYLDPSQYRPRYNLVKIFYQLPPQRQPNHFFVVQISTSGLICHMRYEYIFCNFYLPNRSSACLRCQDHGTTSVSTASSGRNWTVNHTTGRSPRTLSSKSCSGLALSSSISTFVVVFSFEISGSVSEQE